MCAPPGMRASGRRGAGAPPSGARRPECRGAGPRPSGSRVREGAARGAPPHARPLPFARPFGNMAPVSGRGAQVRRALASVGLLGSLAGCDFASPTTTLAPRSDFGQISHDIFLQVLWWDVGILVVVAVVLLLAIVRFRERDPGSV